MCPAFNRNTLPEYLAFGYVSGDETFYQGIHKLLPGHWLEIDQHGKVRIEQYWDLGFCSDQKEVTETEYVSRYRDLLASAVSSHMMSDVPLGVFLSGGLDSSAVAALATEIRGSPIETFSVGYAEHAYSEWHTPRSLHNICIPFIMRYRLASRIFSIPSETDLARGRAYCVAFQRRPLLRGAVGSGAYRRGFDRGG